MKHRKILLPILFCTLSLSAQTYFPLAGNNTVWYLQAAHIDPATQWPDYFHHYFFQFGDDTVIDARVYRKYYYALYENHDSVGVFYAGALREEGKKVYFTHRDSLQERLLYDFGHMDPGDTLPAGHWGYWDENTLLTIRDTGTVQLLDGSTRRLYVYGDPANPVDRRKIIEGIGSEYGLVPIRYATPLPLYVSEKVRVCADHSELLEGGFLPQIPPNGTPCNYVVGTKNLASTAFNFQVFPNPFHRSLFFEIENPPPAGPASLILYNAFGGQIWQQTIETDRMQPVRIPDCPAGTYFLALRTNGGSATKRIIKM